MKPIKFYAFIAALLLTTVSCVEKSEKYKAAIAQRDSLAVEKRALDSSYQQILGLLNDIETGFSEINQNERQLKIDLKGIEGTITNKRELIVAQMLEIKDRIEQNKLKLAELRNYATKNVKAKTMLTQTIKRLEGEMEEKRGQIQSLQLDLNLKNIKISELSATVSDQGQSIAQQQAVLDQQQSVIKTQDADLNRVWYCVASSKKLKEAKIISSSGLFKAKKVLDTDFDKNAFIQVDLKNLKSIPTNSQKVRILSSHPKDSYNLVVGTNKNITIEITNPTKFWSVSKYLVVQI